VYAWKKQLQDQAARAFDLGVGRDGEEARSRAIEKLHAKIGQLTVERDFLAKGSGR
jgi:transposase